MKGGIMRRYHSLFAVSQRLIDAGIVFFLLPLLCVGLGFSYSKTYQLTAILGALFTWIAMGSVDAYRVWRGARLWREIEVLLAGWFMVMVCLLFVAWATKSTQEISRLLIGSWFVTVPIVLIAVHIVQRLLLRYMRMSGRNTRSVVIVGAGDLGRQLAERIMQSNWLGLDLIGFFDDDPKKRGGDVLGVPVIGTTADVYSYVKNQRIDQVYLALPMRSEKVMRKVFDKLQDTTASLFLIPDLFIFELMGARSQEVAGLPVFSLCETPLTGAFSLLKRLEDIALSLLILLTVSPLMFAIAIAVKLTSPGPVIFCQDRYGLNGELIKVYKFRSMSVCENGDTLVQATKGDARITPLGGFLRKTSLDELPQFFNVLQGNMSVVGPRPHAVAHNEQYRKLIKGYMWRHKMKPGITGWAQINGWRGETDTLEKMKKRVEYDLEYIRTWSLWLDLKIVWKTIWSEFTNKNAY